MKYEPTVPQESAHRRIRDAVSLRVGRGKRYSVTGLSEAAGIAPRTIESYKDGSATPGLANFLSLCAALGPGFTSDILSECGQSAKDGSNEDAEHLRVLSALGSLTAQIAEAVADGHVDHREAAQLRQPAQELMQILEPLTRDGHANAVSVPHLGKVG